MSISPTYFLHFLALPLLNLGIYLLNHKIIYLDQEQEYIHENRQNEIAINTDLWLHVLVGCECSELEPETGELMCLLS